MGNHATRGGVDHSEVLQARAAFERDSRGAVAVDHGAPTAESAHDHPRRNRDRSGVGAIAQLHDVARRDVAHQRGEIHGLPRRGSEELDRSVESVARDPVDRDVAEPSAAAGPDAPIPTVERRPRNVDGESVVVLMEADSERPAVRSAQQLDSVDTAPVRREGGELSPTAEIDREHGTVDAPAGDVEVAHVFIAPLVPWT